MATYYVSPLGNDAWSGLSPNPSASDGPFATIGRAVQAIAANPGDDTVYIRDGTYALGTPIQLTAAAPNSSLLACPGERPVISGGTPVSGWTIADGIWTAHVGLGSVQQFVVDGVEQTEARYPNEDPSDPVRGGWLWAQSLPAGHDASLEMAYDKADFPTGRPTVGEKITVFSQAGYSRDVLTIAAVDPNQGIITFDQPATYPVGPGSRYFISAGKPLLDRAGEWWFDRVTQTLYFNPPAGFDGSNAVAAGGDTRCSNSAARTMSLFGV